MSGMEKLLLKAETKQAIADVAGVGRTAVVRWFKKGRLPRTEWTGETQYAEKLSRAFGVSKDDLLKT